MTSDHDTSDGTPRGANPRPPRPDGTVGVGPDPTAPTTVGADPSIPGWLTDDEPEPAPRRYGVLALAVVPWIVVGVLLLRSGPTPVSAQPDPGATPTASATVSPTPAPTTATTETSPPPVAPTGRPGPTIHGGARTATTLADATSLASLVARDWLGGVGPRVGIVETPLHPDAYVAHLAVEAVDHPAPDHVVVTVIGVLLHADDDGYRRAEVVRAAVPISVDGRGARPAGEPWLLRAPELAMTPPPAGEIDDPTLIPEAAAALEAAGYGDVSVTRVEATDGWPFIAVAEAVAPGQQERQTQVVWLRVHGNRFVVAGDRPATEATPTETDREATPGSSPTTASPDEETP